MDIHEILKAKEAIMAFPEATLTLFFGGLAIGWIASFAFSHRELKLHRSIISELRQNNSEGHRQNLLQQALPNRSSLGASVKSLGVILIAACVGALVTWLVQPVSNIRHLKADQRTRMQAALLPAPEGKYSLQVNSAPNCDECEQFAEEIRDFLNSIRGWSATGGPLIFYSPSMTRGTHLLSRVDEANSEPMKKIGDALRLLVDN